MLIKCPCCCREYDIEVGKDVIEFGFKCPNCKNELLITDNKEAVQPSQSHISQSASYSVQVQPDSQKKHSGCWKYLVVFLIIASIFVFTCPNSRDHKDKIQSVVTAAVDDMLRDKSDGTINDLFLVIGSMISTKIIETVITDKITVDNYFFFSVGYHYSNGKRQIISLGVCNHVFTLNEDQVKENLIEYLNNRGIE